MWVAKATRILPFRGRRALGVVLACGINALLTTALVSGRVSVSPSATDEVQPIFLVPRRAAVNRDVASRMPTRARRPYQHAPEAIPAQRMLGPPTETVANVGYSMNPEDQPIQYPSDAPLRSCMRRQDASERDRPDHPSVRLRLFILPDGRVSQGAIAKSSGDDETDQAAFACIQANGNLQPMLVDADPVGAWQVVDIPL